MNYIEYFKKGGKSSQAEDLAQKIFTAAKALQIPAEVVDAKLTELVNAGDQDTMAALQESVDSFISSNGQDQEAAQAIVSVFQSEQSSAMFKCGGKLQQLTDKFAKGGKSRCGCGGIKVAKEGMEVPPEVLKGLMFVEREYTPDGQAVYTMAKSKETLPSNMRSNPFSAYAQNGGEYQGEGQVRIVDDGKGGIRVDADPYGPVGAIQEGLDKEQYIGKLLELLKRARITPGPAFKKNGGIVKGQEGTTAPTLSRREALAAAKNTFGFNGSQARRAYANAKAALRAQGLRGAELKQRAREMMFKMPTIDDEITIEEPQIQLPELPALDTNTPSIQPIRDTNPLASMTDEQLAKAVMAGKYGNGAARRTALGNRYAAVQQIINRGFSKPATPTAVAPSSVATPITTTPTRTSVSNNTQKVLTSSSTIEPSVITATITPSYGQIYGNVPGGFMPQNTPEDLGFHINSNRPASSFGARQSIINRQVEDYINRAGLGIGTDIIFDNGRYIWRNSGAPVEIPIAGRNGNYRPAVERNGGVVKGQNGYSTDYPGHETVSSSPTRMQLSITPSANTEKKDSSFIYQFDPDYTVRYVSVVYDKNGKPSYSLHTSDKRNGRRITEDEFSGYRNKWESLKEFFINNPEFNQRKSYTPFKAPITLNK